jgi:hypothetical protein
VLQAIRHNIADNPAAWQEDSFDPQKSSYLGTRR